MFDYFFYIVSSILISVELNSTSFLIIESRDCIASPENYSIVVIINDTDTKLLNVTFNSNIQYDVGDQLMPNIQYIIRTVIIERTSSTVIDENISIIMYSTYTDPPGYSLYIHVCLCLYTSMSTIQLFYIFLSMNNCFYHMSKGVTVCVCVCVCVMVV